MKKLTYTFIFLILLPLTILSQSPEKIDFQAVARETSGEPITNQNISVLITIQEGLPGDEVYIEKHLVQTDNYGLFSLAIGTGNDTIFGSLYGSFAEIDWSNGVYFTKVEIDRDNGDNYTNMGTMEIMSVPYALYAKESGTSYWDTLGTTIFYNNGKVGIGTSFPINQFQVGGSTSSNDQSLSVRSQKDASIILEADLDNVIESDNPYLLMSQDSGIFRSVLGIVGNEGTSPMDSIFINTIQNATILGTLDSKPLQFGTNREVRLTISNTGKIGIGTTSPDAQLTLDGDGRIRLISNSGYWDLNTWEDGRFGIEKEGLSGFLISEDGKVGIGVTSPTQKLDVNGNARFRSIGSGAHQGALNRMNDGTLTTSTSDARLKKDIQPLENSLEKVEQLQGVSFTWIDEPEMGQRIGMIAQEVEKILPELVFTNKVDGYKGINYAELTAVLVEAIKGQQKTIEEQEQAILEQQKKMLNLEQRIRSLESK